MPFVTRPREATFTFDDDSPIAGLEVRMSTRVGLADMVRMGQAWQNRDPDEMAEAADAIGKYLISWNLEEPTEDSSEPVPATEEGWTSIDAVIKVLLFQRWMTEINERAGAFVPPLSQAPSKNGSSSRAPSAATAAS
jgi:hypothetical protein